MYAVVVTLTLKPDQMNSFMPLMRRNAETSLTEEPGCRQFDVATDPARPEEVFLYEIYDSADAFAAHLSSGHFKDFDAATAEMIADKTVQTYSEVAQ